MSEPNYLNPILTALCEEIENETKIKRIGKYKVENNMGEWTGEYDYTESCVAYLKRVLNNETN